MAYIPFIIFFIIGFIVLFSIINWCYEDATRRGKSAFLVCCAVLFFFPWGLIAWLIFRPDPINPDDV